MQKVLDEYWQGRRERQQKIDESIQRNSECEILYDCPYEDKRKIRVTCAFTVESLSPHRILEPGYAEAAARQEMANIGSYEQMVIDNLRIAGVQNTRREERLKFNALEPFAGTWLHAVGTYPDANGEEKRAAVSIGSGMALSAHGRLKKQRKKRCAASATICC